MSIIEIGWSQQLLQNLTSVLQVQIERKIEVAKEKFEQPNLLISIEKWTT